MATALKTIRNENNLSEKELSKENNLTLTDMVVYLHSSNLNEYDIEVIRKELIGMALESQLRNKSLKDTVGEDYKAFCNELMQNGREKTMYENLLDYLFIFITGIGVLYLIEVFMTPAIANIFTKRDFSMPVTLGFLLSTPFIMILALFVYWYIAKNAFELSGKSKMKYKIPFIAAFTVMWTSGLFLKIYFKNIVLLSINCLYPLLFFIISFIIVKTLINKNIADNAKNTSTSGAATQ